MNRFIMHISWIDSQIVSRTLDSIESALQYSTEPTEFVFFLNEQTFLDTPLEKTPKECWENFIHHPFMKKVQVVYKTNNDLPFGVSRPRIDWMIRDGVNYWGESDCYLPLEYFYVAEHFHKQCQNPPYILSFSERKMWPGWEMQEHESVRNESLESLDKIPEKRFLKCDSILSLNQLYAFNESQGNPKIERIPDNVIPGQQNTLNSTALILSDKMPQNLLCPSLIMTHEDFCLQFSRLYYKIPQYHVSNILKGHDNWNPMKRTNIIDPMGPRKQPLLDYFNKERNDMWEWLNKLHKGQIK
jgi:hypothetical protein